MTTFFQTLREMHPYRLLLIGALALIVLVQGVAMVMVARSQVQKAELREAQERTQRSAATEAARNAAPAKGGLMNVGYVVSR